jgi:hypothetical protein
MNTNAKTPVHLRVVGALAILWNAYGAYDYLMTQTQNATYLAAFTPEQRAFMESFPAWAVGAWAIAVWGAVAGSVLLLLGSRAAAPVFAVAVAAMVIAFLWQYALAPVGALEVMGPAGAAIAVVVWVVAIALLVYTYRMSGKGVLR